MYRHAVTYAHERTTRRRTSRYDTHTHSNNRARTFFTVNSRNKFLQILPGSRFRRNDQSGLRRLPRTPDGDGGGGARTSGQNERAVRETRRDSGPPVATDHRTTLGWVDNVLRRDSLIHYILSLGQE